MTQLPLPLDGDAVAPEAEPDDTIEARFRRFDRDHPEVYATFRRLAERVRRAGHAKFSADAIVQQLRWRYALAGDSGGVKINDHYTACYARKLASERAAFRDFFSFRTLRAER